MGGVTKVKCHLQNTRENALISDYSVGLPKDKTYSGVVILTYLEIDGRICSDGWDNKDASVVCNELGFFKGIAQIHQRFVVLKP